MDAIQYTVRSVPPRLDQSLRKRARLSGKSLNQVIVETLAAQAHITIGQSQKGLSGRLDWFIGKHNIDDKTLTALSEAKKHQKEIARREFSL